MSDRELLTLAEKAAENAYVPYSHFAVGAALECADGSVYTGCNVENAAYGSSICAERTAAVKAVSAGRRDFVRIAIWGASRDYCWPCGACRQFLTEFDRELQVVCGRAAGDYVALPLSALLPHSFDF